MMNKDSIITYDVKRKIKIIKLNLNNFVDVLVDK